MLAGLIDQPYEMDFDRIARLTPRQTFDYYYRPRDKDGNPLPFKHSGQTPLSQSPEQQKALWLAMGRNMIGAGLANFTEEELLAKWDEGERHRLEREAAEGTQGLS